MLHELAGVGLGDSLGPGLSLVSVAAMEMCHSVLLRQGACLTNSPSCHPLGYAILPKLSPHFLGLLSAPDCA